MEKENRTEILIQEWTNYSEVSEETAFDFGTDVYVDGKKLDCDFSLDPEKCVAQMLQTLGLENVEVKFEETDEKSI